MEASGSNSPIDFHSVRPFGDEDTWLPGIGSPVEKDDEELILTIVNSSRKRARLAATQAPDASTSLMNTTDPSLLRLIRESVDNPWGVVRTAGKKSSISVCSWSLP